MLKDDIEDKKNILEKFLNEYYEKKILNKENEMILKEKEIENSKLIVENDFLQDKFEQLTFKYDIIEDQKKSEEKSLEKAIIKKEVFSELLKTAKNLHEDLLQELNLKKTNFVDLKNEEKSSMDEILNCQGNLKNCKEKNYELEELTKKFNLDIMEEELIANYKKIEILEKNVKIQEENFMNKQLEIKKKLKKIYLEIKEKEKNFSEKFESEKKNIESEISLIENLNPNEMKEIFGIQFYTKKKINNKINFMINFFN